MADENIDINIKVQLKEANAELIRARDNFGELSKEAISAAQKVGTLKEKIGDARQMSDAFTDGGKFKAVTNSLAGIAGGFSAIQGAIGLVSNDSKALAETTKKLQSAMALTQGLSALSELGDSFKTLKVVAINTFNGIKAAIGSTGIGLLVIALGAIVAYWDEISAAVSGVSQEQEALNVLTAENAKASQDNLDALNASEQQLKLSGKSEEEIYQLKLKQYDTTIADAEAKAAADQATLEAQISASQRNKEILSGVLQFLTAPLQVLLGAIDEVGKALGQDFGLRDKLNDMAASLVFDPESIAEEGKKAKEESDKSLNALRESRAALINGHNQKERSEANKIAEQKKADEKKLQDELKKIAEEAAFEVTKLGKSELEKQKIDIEEKYREKLAIVKKGSQAEIDLLALKNAELAAAEKEASDKAREKEKERVATELSDKEKALDDKFAIEELGAQTTLSNQEELDRKLLELKAKKLEEEIALQKQYGNDTSELEAQLALTRKEISDSEVEDARAKYIAKRELAVAELDLVMQAGQLIQELAGKNKKLQIAGLIIEQAGAIGKIIANTGIANAKSIAASPLTAGQPWVTINTISAALSAASVIAGVAKSINQINSSGSNNSSPAGGGSEPGAKPTSMYANGGLLSGPSHQFGGIKTAMGELEGGEFVINKRSTSAFLPLLQALNDQGRTDRMGSTSTTETPIFKTYVVASEMSSQQEANKRVNDLAKL